MEVRNNDDYTPTISTTPFRLIYTDDTEVEPAGTGYDQYPKSEFPWITTRWRWDFA